MAKLISGLGLSLVLTIASCGGGGGGGGVCGEPIPACTGDPVGTWVVDSVCGFKPHGCDGATSSASASQKSGSLILVDGGSGSLELDLTFSYRSTIPLACTTSCADLDDVIGGCAESGEDCRCSGMMGLGLGSSFSWQADAGSVVLQGGGEPVGWVCVTDDLAYLQTDDHVFVTLRRAP